MKTYEIYNLTTGELLADNLIFDDVPELFGAYAEFFPDHEIAAYYREQPAIKRGVRVVPADEVGRNNFYAEWFDFMDELLAMDNIH